MWLNIRTEYSFREAYGPVQGVVDFLKQNGATAAAISDTHNTFGHVPWTRACEAVGIKPVYASTFSVVNNPEERTRVQHPARVSIIALNTEGLRELYELVKLSYSQFYYYPRLGYADLVVSPNLAVTLIQAVDTALLPPSGRFYGLLAAGLNRPWPTGITPLAGQMNSFIYPSDLLTWELLTERNAGTIIGHLLDEDEFDLHWPDQAQALANTYELLERATATIPSAPMARFPLAGNKVAALENMCVSGAVKRGIDLNDPTYKARLKRELDMIAEKDYADYFLIVADLVQYAKQHMLVGPSRGSSAGSLVCYLIDITEIDPIPYGLLFERFIDINREDLPDIDIDFPDSRRQMVIDYLSNKYGQENVIHIGTISRLMPRSAIGLFAKSLGIPPFETDGVKGAIIERSSGDARAAMCIEDTFTTTEVGKQFIEKYPNMRLVSNVEGHARHSGVHAAGIVVCNNAVTNYCGIDSRNDVAMIDKEEAEALNLLKIDVLGLRTLSILEDCCEDAGVSFETLYNLPLDDPQAFQIFNDMKLAGIFQFEGYALQSLTRQMGVHEFNDIAAITALARPGPLHNGGATEFIQRRTGKAPIVFYSDHPVVKQFTENELGTFIYQEQIMSIGREFGGLSWQDVSALRKAMSKSYGEEFFNKYRIQFLRGATANAGISEEEADKVWKNMVTFGSWGFNKSHAVGYGILSYWCAWLKAYHPLEFAKANLNHARSEEQSLKLLREFNFPYRPVDKDVSTTRWEVHDGELVGPLTNVHGIGPVYATDIVQRREEGKDLTKRQATLLTNPTTAFDELFPAERLWGEAYKNPRTLSVTNNTIRYIREVQYNGRHCFIGKLIDRNLRDLNEYGNVVKRGGKRIEGPSLFLNMTVEDDTDSIICTIGRFQFQKFGKEIAESGRIGEDWYLILGDMKNDWRKIYVVNIRKLDAEQPAQAQAN